MASSVIIILKAWKEAMQGSFLCTRNKLKKTLECLKRIVLNTPQYKAFYKCDVDISKGDTY